MIIGFNSRQKKPVIKETILIEKSMTLGKSKSQFSTRTIDALDGNLSSLAQPNGISWWDFGWALLLLAYTWVLTWADRPAGLLLNNQLGWMGRRGRFPSKNINHAGQHWAFSIGYLTEAHRYQNIQFKLAIWRRKKKNFQYLISWLRIWRILPCWYFFSSITRWNSSNFRHCFSSPRIGVVPSIAVVHGRFLE